MSPTLVFPSPFRSRDLPPYGSADWKRLQPALLRRSLALSSGIALLAGLTMAFVLQHAHIAPPEIPVTHIVDPHVPAQPPPIPLPHTGFVAPAKPSGGVPIPRPDVPDVDPSKLTPNPGPVDPNAKPGVNAMGEDTSHAVGALDRPGPYDYVDLEELPQLLHSPSPEYPELARVAGMEGEVRLRVLVNQEGNVQEVLMERSNPAFDEAAEKAIRQWRFRPAIMNHQPVSAWVSVPIRFTLHGD